MKSTRQRVSYNDHSYRFKKSSLHDDSAGFGITSFIAGTSMKWRDWLAQWKLVGLKINLKFLEMAWTPAESDRDAAWELYVEMLTRITTQPLPQEQGDEAVALQSVHALFGLTREIIKKHGRSCQKFTMLAIVVLNQIVRPFTAKWHKMSLAGAFSDPASRAVFRSELGTLQVELRKYTRMLADMAGVEDLSSLEEPDNAPIQK